MKNLGPIKLKEIPRCTMKGWMMKIELGPVNPFTASSIRAKRSGQGSSSAADP